MRSLHRAAVGVHLALAGQVASMAALVVFEEARGRRLAAQIASFGGDPDAPGADAVVGAVTIFAILMMLLAAATLTAAIAYLRWLHEARRGASARSTAAGWLLPGVNLVVPPFLVDGAWHDAGRVGRARWLTLLAAWWASWLTAIWLVAVRLPLRQGTDLTGLGLTELAVTALAALLCAATVHEITHGHSIAARAPLFARRLRAAHSSPPR